MGRCALAGVASGVAVTFFHNPMELWKVRVQTHLSRSYSAAPGKQAVVESQLGTHNAATVLKSLLKNPTQLFRGASMTLVDNSIGNGIYFGTYESLRIGLGNRDNWSWGTEMLVGGLTGVVFKGAMYPVDLVRARVMTNVEGLRAADVAGKIYRDSGVLGFYRGVSVTILRAFTINSAGWPALRAAQWALGLEE